MKIIPQILVAILLVLYIPNIFWVSSGQIWQEGTQVIWLLENNG